MPLTELKDEVALIAKRSPSGLITVEAASTIWKMTTSAASRRLSSLTAAGWLRRVRRGTYRLVPLDAGATSSAAFDDPWVLAEAAFSPCYVGGWSAAEHWGLTEQLFRSTFVVTGAHVRAKQVELGGLLFRLARVPAKRAAGDAVVWRASARAHCSSPELTLVDGANSPTWVGGVRHLSEMFARYVDDVQRDPEALSRALLHRARGAGAKRLGFIAESLAVNETEGSARTLLANVIRAAATRRTTGVVKLDPAVRTRGPMNTAWGLWVNVDVRPDAG